MYFPSLASARQESDNSLFFPSLPLPNLTLYQLCYPGRCAEKEGHVMLHAGLTCSGGSFGWCTREQVIFIIIIKQSPADSCLRLWRCRSFLCWLWFSCWLSKQFIVSTWKQACCEVFTYSCIYLHVSLNLSELGNECLHWDDDARKWSVTSWRIKIKQMGSLLPGMIMASSNTGNVSVIPWPHFPGRWNKVTGQLIFLSTNTVIISRASKVGRQWTGSLSRMPLLEVQVQLILAFCEWNILKHM